MAFYHERTTRGQIRVWAPRLALILLLFPGLAGCAVSMPMGSLLGDAVEAPAAAPAVVNGAPAKGKIDVAVAQPQVP